MTFIFSYMKRIILILFLFASLGISAQELGLVADSTRAYTNTPKREFRGVWVHTIGQDYFASLTSEQVRDTLCRQLDLFQELGFNTLLFQIRPEGDAFYKSDIEPWSRYLTGEQGKEPDDEYFDPMQFLIDECHSRCMEFHAWMNPYRANINKANPLAWGHIYGEKRYMFVSYGQMLLWNPGVPESREFICKVVKDVVTRYDVDAIHFDDYFYPYPIRGLKFPDEQTFRRYGHEQGFSFNEKDNWRRHNVDLLIHELHDTIRSVKPWVRFGISPFGIYRNKSRHENGSDTNGLSCYDDLYADVLLWIRNGWIDYCVPQLYWPDGHKNADYTTLLKWWSKYTLAPCKLYVGQDVSRTYQQMNRKMTLARETRNVEGNCFFSGKMIIENLGGIQDSLRAYQSKPALLPEYGNIDTEKPKAPQNLRLAICHKDSVRTNLVLNWDMEPDSTMNEKNEVRFYAVYVFDDGEDINLENTNALVTFTTNKEYEFPNPDSYICKYMVVTSVDRMHNESLPAFIQYDPERVAIPELEIPELKRGEPTEP